VCVKHPFIIQYIEDLLFVGKDIKRYCIITGFASEGDLENVLKKYGKMNEDQALDFCVMILLGLDFIHK